MKLTILREFKGATGRQNDVILPYMQDFES